MAETNAIFSVLCTTASKVKDISIKNGQLIFVRDTNKIALDFNSKRTFYNQITELASDEERTSILAPVKGHYYFVIGTAVLWTYQDAWVQITSQPSDIVFIGTEMPELGADNKIYINTQNKEISVWDADNQKYIVVANHKEIQEITESDIDSIFN